MFAGAFRGGCRDRTSLARSGLCHETSHVPASARKSQRCTRLVPAKTPSLAITGNTTCLFAGLSSEPSDGFEPSGRGDRGPGLVRSRLLLRGVSLPSGDSRTSSRARVSGAEPRRSLPQRKQKRGLLESLATRRRGRRALRAVRGARAKPRRRQPPFLPSPFPGRCGLSGRPPRPLRLPYCSLREGTTRSAGGKVAHRRQVA
jgi:hypothetical protein